MTKSCPRFGYVCALLFAATCALTCTVSANAQNQNIDPRLKASLQNSLQLEKKLSPTQRRFLSEASLTRFALAHQILDSRPNMLQRWMASRPAKATTRTHGQAIRSASEQPAMVSISSPAFDFTFSRGGGFSQNDTSTAWCGSNVVTGYNDSSAILATLLAGGGLSFSGVSHSEDGGQSFTDLGYLDPGASQFNFLVGNPSVACGDASHFYYASMFGTAIQKSPRKIVFKEAIAINTSSDGGRTWSTPAAAVLMNGSNILQRESLAVDPSNPQHLYISFTNLDFNIARTGSCAGDTQMLVELVSSADGGNTWGKPRIIKRICNNSGNAVNGSHVAVAPSGDVYVAYLFFDNVDGRELIQVRRSTNHGNSFRVPVDVATVIPVGGDGQMQGLFDGNQYPSLAVDRSNSNTRGTIYIAWNDGRNRSQPDIFAGSGVYNFADVFFVKSTDLGHHWSNPVGVSPAAPDASRDQFMPGVAVDSTGRLSVCYSDRRNDPQNDAIDHYCSVSQDAGATFQDLRLTDTSWSPSHFTDLVLKTGYMQDYDGVSPDWTGVNSGFFASFQFQNYGNPNAFGARF
jgi:hypothetical protein